MEFVNLFIGSMGGIPAFMGSLAVYYMLALAVKTESEAQKGKAADKTQIKNFLINYALFYVIVWIAMEVILFISRFSGWGNVKKLNVKQYFKGIYGASVSDSWIYIFAAFLVFAFIVSLFPLIFCQNEKILDRIYYDRQRYTCAYLCHDSSCRSYFLYLDQAERKQCACLMNCFYVKI